MLEVSLLGVGTVLRLERDAWSMVKRLRQATNEYAPPFRRPPLSQSGGRVRHKVNFFYYFYFFFILRRMGKNKALAHHTSTTVKSSPVPTTNQLAATNYSGWAACTVRTERYS